MSFTLRPVAVLVGGGFACAVLWSLAEDIRENLHKLHTWHRQSVLVTGTAQERIVEVELPDSSRLDVPVHSGHAYSNWDHVTLLQNPEDPSARSLTGILDLWYPVLSGVVILGLIAITCFILWRMEIGYQRIWASGRWINTFSGKPPMSPVTEVRPPREAWKANLFWGTILGGGLILSSVFSEGEPDSVSRIFFAWASVMFIGWMLWMSVDHYTQVIRADRGGIELQSRWGSRYVGWREVAKVELVDVRARLNKLQAMGARGRMKTGLNTIPEIRLWTFTDAAGKTIFKIDREAKPADQLAKLISLARNDDGPAGPRV